MSFWVLQSGNLREQAFVMPLAVGPRIRGISWKSILNYSKFTLWLMLATTACFVVFMGGVIVFFVYMLIALLSIETATAIGYSIAAVLATSLAVKMLQSTVRLWIYLKRGGVSA